MPMTRGKIPSALCHSWQIFVLTFSKTITGIDKDNGGDLTRAQAVGTLFPDWSIGLGRTTGSRHNSISSAVAREERETGPF